MPEFHKTQVKFFTLEELLENPKIMGVLLKLNEEDISQLIAKNKNLSVLEK